MREHLWQTVLGEVELSVSRGNYVTWFKNTRLLRQTEDTLIIGVGNVFIKQQMERKYHQLILDILQKNGVGPITVEYKIHSLATKKNSPNQNHSLRTLKHPVSNPSHQNPRQIASVIPIDRVLTNATRLITLLSARETS